MIRFFPPLTLGSLALFALSILEAPALPAQQKQTQPGNENGRAPIYRVTVVERSIKAINYRYRSGPTKVDLQGTVLMPKAEGEAEVQSKQGYSEIDARVEHLGAPAAFGREYLTYVLWALSPDGRPHNLGEIIADSKDRGSIRVTTDLQAFALLVTAEPYASVRQPSDVVVLENVVRPDTTGIIEQVNARVELLPRGHYNMTAGGSPRTDAPAPKVSMQEYETLLALYQAQNAIGIAESAHAGRYAESTLSRAKQLFANAQQLHDHKGDRTMVIQQAREAAQTAEDARLIASEDERRASIEKSQAEIKAAEQARDAALRAADRAKADAQAAREQVDAERAARLRSSQGTEAQ